MIINECQHNSLISCLHKHSPKYISITYVSNESLINNIIVSKHYYETPLSDVVIRCPLTLFILLRAKLLLLDHQRCVEDWIFWEDLNWEKENKYDIFNNIYSLIGSTWSYRYKFTKERQTYRSIFRSIKSAQKWHKHVVACEIGTQRI